MSKFSNRILAATAALCLVSSSAFAEEMHISYKGLDLNRPADAAVFKARVAKAARDLCIDYVASPVDPDAQRRCIQAILDEAEAGLPDGQRQALARGLQSTHEIVSAAR